MICPMIAETTYTVAHVPGDQSWRWPARRSRWSISSFRPCAKKMAKMARGTGQMSSFRSSLCSFQCRQNQSSDYSPTVAMESSTSLRRDTT